eukprot:scaffold18034_cov166-Skeletonema_marinoi.AAC.1
MTQDYSSVVILWQLDHLAEEIVRVPTFPCLPSPAVEKVTSVLCVRVRMCHSSFTRAKDWKWDSFCLCRQSCFLLCDHIVGLKGPSS